MKSKISYLEDKMDELLYYNNDAKNEEKYEDRYDEEETKERRERETNKSKRISQGCYNTRIYDSFYDNDNTRFDFWEGRGRGFDRFIA
jgi:hypothetical protein